MRPTPSTCKPAATFTTEMSSAVRPSFWNDQPQRLPFVAGTTTSTSSDWRSPFVPRTARYSATGSLRLPLALATTTTASNTSSGVTRSAAGEPFARFPPTVATPRI